MSYMYGTNNHLLRYSRLYQAPPHHIQQVQPAYPAAPFHHHPQAPFRPLLPRPTPAYSYPPIDATVLRRSALLTQQNLLKQADQMLLKLSSSEDLSHRIMVVAQQGQTDEVKRLLRSTGVTSDIEVKYNPDSIRIELSTPNPNSVPCCKLSVDLLWRSG